jgi:hypothetical protein
MTNNLAETRDSSVKEQGRKKEEEERGKQSGVPRDAKTDGEVRDVGRVAVAVRGAHDKLLPFLPDHFGARD